MDLKVEKLKTNTIQTIDCHDLDALVTKVYGRPYCFQQQNGCKDRGITHVEVPSEGYDYENDTLPEVVNDPNMGVSFKAWLARDPKQKIENQQRYDWELDIWWTRNFYPSIHMVLNDLHNKGLVDAGSYTIIIDWWNLG